MTAEPDDEALAPEGVFGEQTHGWPSVQFPVYQLPLGIVKVPDMAAHAAVAAAMVVEGEVDLVVITALVIGGRLNQTRTPSPPDFSKCRTTRT